MDKQEIENGKEFMRKQKEIAQQVQEGLLTLEEGAQCLAGARIKLLFLPTQPVDHEQILKTARHDIESHLPGYRGMKLDDFRN